MIATCTICHYTDHLLPSTAGEWESVNGEVWIVQEIEAGGKTLRPVGPVICEACRDEKTRAVAAKIADRLETLQARAKGVPE